MINDGILCHKNVSIWRPCPMVVFILLIIYANKDLNDKKIG